jgi:thiamine pyrophosphate-dependent acetolactate synthase large subunit-like protein
MAALASAYSLAWLLPGIPGVPTDPDTTARAILDLIDPPIEFATLARSVGVQGHRIETPTEFGAAYARALAAREPLLLEVMIDGSA